LYAPTLNKNTLFYSNRIRSEPHGDTIDNIHSNWFAEYTRLETHHGYIQWLFPLQSDGTNSKAQPLQYEEIEWFSAHPEAQRRLLTSYEMMLDFYGIVLKDRHTGEVEKAQNWRERFQNLNCNSHNFRRITRIIASMSVLGYGRLMPPLVELLAAEIYHPQSTLPQCRDCCQRYWLPALLPQYQQDVYQFVSHLQEQRHLSADEKQT
jgi:hypothetical protein